VSFFPRYPQHVWILGRLSMAKIDDLAQANYEPTVEIIPLGYEQNKDGIFKIKEKLNKKTGEIIKYLSPISLTSFTVKNKLYNTDTGEVFYIIEFDDKIVVVSGCDLSQKKGIMQLAGQGVLTTENYAKDLSEYIT
jgi:hypothetical protein